MTMKFDTEEDQHIYEIAQEGSTYLGDVAGPYGWAAMVYIEGQWGPRDQAVMDRYDGAQHFIVRENSDGIVMIRPFHEAEEATRAWAMLAEAISLSDAEITDEETREAIDGYLQAAAFTATDEAGDSLDGKGLSWSQEAQEAARSDVIGFITQNVEDVREFLAVTGHTWTQVGIDFNFTRNGQGAGFWDRGAGDVGVRLTESSKPWGEASVFVNENEEMDFA